MQVSQHLVRVMAWHLLNAKPLLVTMLILWTIRNKPQWILCQISFFSLKQILWKMSSAKRWPFYSCLNMLSVCVVPWHKVVEEHFLFRLTKWQKSFPCKWLNQFSKLWQSSSAKLWFNPVNAGLLWQNINAFSFYIIPLTTILMLQAPEILFMEDQDIPISQKPYQRCWSHGDILMG